MSSWKDIQEARRRVDPAFDDPARVTRRAAITRAMVDAASLSELRDHMGLTQCELARQWGVSQANVSRVERADDLYLSTLADYVTALGGRLQIAAAFGGEPSVIIELSLRPMEAKEGSSTAEAKTPTR